MKLIYIANADLSANGKLSILDSQVFELLNYYARNIGEFKEIIFFAGINRKTIPNEYLINVLDKKISINYFVNYPDYFLINKLTERSIYALLSGIENLEEYIIHVRTETLALYVNSVLKRLKINNLKLVADVRGSAYHEMLEYSRANFLLKQVKLFSKKIAENRMNRFKNITVVSDALKDLLIKSNSKISNENVTVIPCLSGKRFVFDNLERLQIRGELGVSENEILLIHVTGGDSSWQNTFEVIKVLSSLDIKVLNLSKSKFDYPNVINKYIGYNDVPKYLSASDIAILWREESITNYVSCPVKFSEYVCVGLPVISNNSIKSVFNYITNNNAGAIIKDFSEIDRNLILKLISINRAELCNKGLNVYGVDSIATKYLQFYKKINNESINCV